MTIMELLKVLFLINSGRERTYNEKWQKGETLNVGIGQGFLLSTPLELAIMTANIINNGNLIRPNIVKSISGEKIAEC